MVGFCREVIDCPKCSSAANERQIRAAQRRQVEPMALAAIAAGADGVMVEVHNDPDAALCDGPQSLTLDQFDAMMDKLRPIAGIVGRTIAP